MESDLTWEPEIHFVKDSGHVMVRHLHGHPLADRRGRTYRHRFVLFEAQADDRPMDCTWCGYVLPWRSPEITSANYRYVINVDHLNGIPGDDRLENLVPACWWCNANRSWAPQASPFWWDRFRRWFGQVHPAQRPNLMGMVAEVLDIPVEALQALRGKESAA